MEKITYILMEGTWNVWKIKRSEYLLQVCISIFQYLANHSLENKIFSCYKRYNNFTMVLLTIKGKGINIAMAMQ